MPPPMLMPRYAYAYAIISLLMLRYLLTPCATPCHAATPSPYFHTYSPFRHCRRIGKMMSYMLLRFDISFYCLTLLLIFFLRAITLRLMPAMPPPPRCHAAISPRFRYAA